MTLPTELIPRFRGHSPAIPVYADPSLIEAGRFVKITGKNDQGAYKATHTGAGQDADGVSERKVPAVSGTPNNNNATNTCGEGAIARVVAGAAVAALAKVASDASGRAVTAASGNHVLGKALTAAAQAGDVIEVQLHKEGILA